MSDLSIKRVEEFDSPNGGGFCRARASLGVTSFGMQVENFPPHFEHFPEHDHTADGQEEVYTVLSGSATLHAEGATHRLAPGVFARVGAMVMLLPGLGESNIPVRIKLAIALVLTLVILPLHRQAYQIDMQSMVPLVVMMIHELIVGIVLGATARVTLSALQVGGSIIAQQMGLGFVTSVDPTQGQQGVLIGNFLTMLGVTLLFATDSHYLVIAALNDSYNIFSPADLMPSGDIAALAIRAFTAAFRIGMQLSAPFLVFGLVFNIGLGVLARLMPQMQVYFVGVPLSILAGFLIFSLVLVAMMGTFLNYFTGVMHDLTP